MEIIIFSVLLVVGVLAFITMNVPGYFPAVNASASATRHQRSVKNIQRLEHELGMCESGCPHHVRPPRGGMRPPRATVNKSRQNHRVLSAGDDLWSGRLSRVAEPETHVIRDHTGQVVAMIGYDDGLTDYVRRKYHVQPRSSGDWGPK